MTDKPLNPWQPERDPVNLAVLGKAIEEMGEAISMLGRCIIQGIEEAEPVTGKPNRVALEDELADVAATAAMVVERFKLHTDRMSGRVAAKTDHLTRWHALIEPGPSEAGTTPLPSDVVRLVIAARSVAYEDRPALVNLHELDKAAEAFASRVPWRDA